MTSFTFQPIRSLVSGNLLG